MRKCEKIQKTGVVSVDNSIEGIRQYYTTMTGCLTENNTKRIVVIGSVNPCFFGFYEQLRKNNRNMDFVWMRYKKKYTETYTHGLVIKIPQDISRIYYHLLINETELSYLEMKKIEDNPYYKWAYNNIMYAYPNNEPNNVRKTILLTEQYFLNVYALTKPSAIIIWNPYVSFNKIAEYVAREKGICVVYAESGVIPGTIGLSTWGDLGESRPSVEPEYFLNLPITVEEIEAAMNIVAYIRDSRFNRNIQPQIKNKFMLYRKRPVIFLAGQNDSECGLQPYDNLAKNYSQMFDSSESALAYIAEVALKNNWNILYKPHPIVARRMLEKKAVPGNVIYITEGDINDFIDCCDVCITILSTTAYVALIRGKPVVMLGKIQISGQGCVYEAFEKDKIEQVIRKALEYRYTKEQNQAFVEHVARMCKYCLYDSQQPRDIHYGQSIENAVSFIERAINGEAEF